MKRQQHEQVYQQQMDMEQKQPGEGGSQYSGGYSGTQMQQSPSPMKQNSDWVELEDHYNMIDENSIEPDYFIDTVVSSLLTLIFVAFSCIHPGRKGENSCNSAKRYR